MPSKRERGVHSKSHKTDIKHIKRERRVADLSIFEPWHGISKNVVCATSKASDQPAHTRSLIKAFASRLNIL